MLGEARRRVRRHYVVVVSPGRYLVRRSHNGAWTTMQVTSRLEEAYPYMTLEIAQYAADAVGGTVIEVRNDK